MRDGWYQNTTWDAEVERKFNEKLRRARNKTSYLEFQARILAESHPQVALKLLARYFELGGDSDLSLAQYSRAKALLALDRIEEALDTFEDALAREAECPNIQSRARHHLPYLIASLRIRNQYQRASELLQLTASNLILPIDEFLWHTAQALIAGDTGETESARSHAEQALKAANREHSGFRYHPTVGLVSSKYDDVIKKLKTLCIP